VKFSNFAITSLWGHDGLRPADIGDRIERTLSAVSDLSPAMDNGVVLDRVHERAVPLADARSGWECFVERNIWKDDWGRPSPDSGYLTVIQGSEEPTDVGAANTVQFVLTAGSKFSNNVEFEVGQPNLPVDPQITTYPIYLGVVRALAMVWPCPWVMARFYSYKGRKAGLDQERRTPFDMSWIAYLSAPFAEGLRLPADLGVQQTPGGGLIISAVETLIDEANADHLRRSKLLQRILSDRVGQDTLLFRPIVHAARQGPC
jgi:hypothetical protein